MISCGRRTYILEQYEYDSYVHRIEAHELSYTQFDQTFLNIKEARVFFVISWNNTWNSEENTNRNADDITRAGFSGGKMLE